MTKRKKEEIIPITYLGTEYEILVTNMGLAVRRVDNSIPSKVEIGKILDYVRTEGLISEL